MPDRDDGIYRVYEELFRGLERLAPGSDATTRGLIERLRPWLPVAPRVVEFGCGAGADTLPLALAWPQAHVVALDLGAGFLEPLSRRAEAHACAARIDARVGDMGHPAAAGLLPDSVDLIWCAAAVYSIGIDVALPTWKPLLRPAGLLVCSELVWVAEPAARAAASVAFWQREYPAMRHGDAIVELARAAGFEVLDRVRQPRADWAAYYEPLRPRVAAMRAVATTPVASAILDGFQAEIDLFDSDDPSFAYEFFVLRPGYGRPEHE